MFKIILTDTFNDYSRVAFRSNSRDIAIQIRDEMNRLNSEAARLTGQTIRYVYSVLQVK
jgi:hypothetical protein